MRFSRLCQNHILSHSHTPSSLDSSIMGNGVSCTPSILYSSSSLVRVLFMDGKIQIFNKPIKAVEIMVDNPNQFLCNSSSLKVGHRIPGLAEDDDLELRQFYFLLPMDLLYSVLTSEEMSALSYRASKAIKHERGFTSIGKIFPVCIFSGEGNKKTTTTGSVDKEDGRLLEREGSVERFVKQRSWKPALETIVEC